MAGNKYEPTPDELADGEENLTEYQTQLSRDRREMMKGVDLELLKKCNLELNANGMAIMGTIDGTAIRLRLTPEGGYGGGIGDPEVFLDNDMAEKLWQKYYPIAKIIKHDGEMETTGEQAKLEASRLLSL